MGAFSDYANALKMYKTYRLIKLYSENKIIASRFPYLDIRRKWVTSYVLPSIGH